MKGIVVTIRLTEQEAWTLIARAETEEKTVVQAAHDAVIGYLSSTPSYTEAPKVMIL